MSSIHTKGVSCYQSSVFRAKLADIISGIGVSIGRFGSIFANFFKTESNRLDLVTEPNRTDSVQFSFSIFSVRLIYFHHSYIF